MIKAQIGDSLISKNNFYGDFGDSLALNDSIAQAHYAVVDAYVLHLKKRYRNIPSLAKDLTATFTSPEDKVRAIFRWMTNNISYDCADYHNKNKTLGGGVSYSSTTSKSQITAQWANMYYRYANRVLRKRKGICEGYAILFYELCNQSGINCEIIHGFADQNSKRIGKYKTFHRKFTNHAWDSVELNGNWYDLDATWASGSCDEEVRHFYKGFNAAYYLTSAKKSFADHIQSIKETEKLNRDIGN